MNMRVGGSFKLDDINDVLETKFDSEDYDSIGGIMIELLDTVSHRRANLLSRRTISN